jgi:hypothetical protein
VTFNLIWDLLAGLHCYKYCGYLDEEIMPRPVFRSVHCSCTFNVTDAKRYNRFEAYNAVTVKCAIFRDEMTGSVVDGLCRFGETHFIHLQGRGLKQSRDEQAGSSMLAFACAVYPAEPDVHITIKLSISPRLHGAKSQ